MLEKIFELSASVRYVALRQGADLTLRERPGLAAPSSSESDRYEELIVNPTLLTLVQSRGDIDCGGGRWVLIRYGNFFEFVRPVPGGHLSVGIEPGADVMEIVDLIEQALPELGLGA